MTATGASTAAAATAARTSSSRVPPFERDPRRLLDHAAVHDGIRVRDADLDRVGTGRVEHPQEPHVHPGWPPVT
jgi:hypothetical protein